MSRPLLFLDVDGPLLPFGATGYPRYPPRPGPAENPLLARLNPALGPRLAALGAELVWATTWEEEANDALAPRLGLPPLPVVRWPEASEFDELDERAGRHWKTRPLVEFAAGRPFAWVDDELTAADRTWVAAEHPAPALLRRVDPAQGLTDADFAALAQWLREVIQATK